MFRKVIRLAYSGISCLLEGHLRRMSAVDPVTSAKTDFVIEYVRKYLGHDEGYTSPFPGRLNAALLIGAPCFVMTFTDGRRADPQQLSNCYRVGEFHVQATLNLWNVREEDCSRVESDFLQRYYAATKSADESLRANEVLFRSWQPRVCRFLFEICLACRVSDGPRYISALLEPLVRGLSATCRVFDNQVERFDAALEHDELFDELARRWMGEIELNQPLPVETVVRLGKSCFVDFPDQIIGRDCLFGCLESNGKRAHISGVMRQF